MVSDPGMFELSLLAGVVVCIVGIALIVSSIRSERLLAKWAFDNKLTITKVGRIFSRQTFVDWLTGMQVLHVSFNDIAGRAKQARVRIGDPMKGVLGSSILVEMLDRSSRLDSGSAPL